jgi:peptidoglycan-associated lipoprotein
MKTAMLILTIAGLATGCSSAPVKEQPAQPAKVAAEQPRPTSPPAKVAPKITTQPAERTRIVVDPLNDPNSPLARRSIYYDFDSSGIKDEFKPVIQAHAGYLTSHRTARIKIEGNCDERGSREYNLALGQRRADGIKSTLSLLGVADEQSETVSWGEEKPRSPGHDESAWAQNRRSDIVYEAPRR